MDLPKWGYKNEIEFILTGKPHIVTDASVIDRFNTGSDHHMVRGTLTINTKLERARLTRRQKKPNGVVLFTKATQFQLLLTNGFEALKMGTSEPPLWKL